MTVLILARDLDSSADRMVETLGQRGMPVFRTDLAAFPQELVLDARFTGDGWDGVLATEHRQVRFPSPRRCAVRVLHELLTGRSVVREPGEQRTGWVAGDVSIDRLTDVRSFERCGRSAASPSLTPRR